MTTLQNLLSNSTTYDQEIIEHKADPEEFKTIHDKFIFLAEKYVLLNKLHEKEVEIVCSPFFEAAVKQSTSMYDLCLYIINENSRIDTEELFSCKCYSTYTSIEDCYFMDYDTLKIFQNSAVPQHRLKLAFKAGLYLKIIDESMKIEEYCNDYLFSVYYDEEDSDHENEYTLEEFIEYLNEKLCDVFFGR